MKTRNGIVASIVFVFILGTHIALGANHAVRPAKVSGWIDNLGSAFDVAVGKAMDLKPIAALETQSRLPASVRSDVKAVP